MTITLFFASETNKNILFSCQNTDNSITSSNWNDNSFFGTPDLISVNDGVMSINSIITGIINCFGAQWILPVLAVFGVYTIVSLKSRDSVIAVLLGIMYLLLYVLPLLKQENMILVESAAFLPWFILSLYLYISKFSLTRMGFFLFNFILTAYSNNVRISIFTISFSLIAILWNSVDSLRKKRMKVYLKKLGFYFLSVLVILPNLIITWSKNSITIKQLELVHFVFNGVNQVNSMSEKVYSLINLPLNLKALFSITSGVGISLLLFTLLLVYSLTSFKKSVKPLLYISILIVVNFVINIKTESHSASELFLFCGLLLIFYINDWFSDLSNNYVIIAKPMSILISAAVIVGFFILNLISYLFVSETTVNGLIFRNSLFFYPVSCIMLLGLFAFIHRKIPGSLLLLLCAVVIFSEFLFMNVNYNLDNRDSSRDEELVFHSSKLEGYNTEDGYFFYPGKDFYSDPRADHLKMLNGNTDFISSRYRRVTEKLVDKQRITGDPFNWNIINMLNVKYILFNMKLKLQNLKYVEYDRENELIMYENTDRLPIVRIVTELVNCNSVDDVLDSLVFTDNIAERAFVVNDSLYCRSYSDSVDIKDIKLVENSVSFEINVKDTAFVVLAKNYFEGLYSLRVDGKNSGYIPVNHCLVGFPVNPGNHNINFRIIHHDNKVWTFLQNILILLSIIFILFSKVKYLAYCFPEKAEKIKTAVKSLIQKWRSNGKT